MKRIKLVSFAILVTLSSASFAKTSIARGIKSGPPGGYSKALAERANKLRGMREQNKRIKELRELQNKIRIKKGSF